MGGGGWSGGGGGGEVAFWIKLWKFIQKFKIKFKFVMVVLFIFLKAESISPSGSLLLFGKEKTEETNKHQNTALKS